MRERYGQFCPIAKALELVGSRWTPLILRELLAGSCRFSELQRGLPLLSRSLLAQRLKQMEDDGLITARKKTSSRGFEYRLTASGFAVLPVLDALCEWGLRFAQGRITPEDCEPAQMSGRFGATLIPRRCRIVASSSASSFAMCRQAAAA